MKIVRIALQVLLSACISLGAQAQEASPASSFMSFEGKLKNADAPAWQMIAMIHINGESDINPRFNQLLTALITFVKKGVKGRLASCSISPSKRSTWR
ncbi:hypothetical protein [Massilia glaciei]|uniref:hypothetical protein n=1 Tax=Massilia glaciei TaxID=1524097 RepID=UPI0011B20D6B|nr:hypothetical protein [Massilia glaciei]